uniref:Uncharacterized protein n=1 Tax=Oryza meridionalis TaxID=40149 RepID=A0A0E0F0T7_9ORYZ
MIIPVQWQGVAADGPVHRDPFSFTCRNGSNVDFVDGGGKSGKKPQGGRGEDGGAAENKPKGESLVARLLHHRQHVAHIGWDNSTNTTTRLHSWNHEY